MSLEFFIRFLSAAARKYGIVTGWLQADLYYIVLKHNWRSVCFFFCKNVKSLQCPPLFWVEQKDCLTFTDKNHVPNTPKASRKRPESLFRRFLNNVSILLVPKPTFQLREQLLDEGPLLSGTDSGEDFAAVVEGHVDGGLTHSSRTSVDKDALTTLDLAHHDLGTKRFC